MVINHVSESWDDLQEVPKWRLSGTSQPNSINLRHTGSEGFTCPAAPGKTKTTSGVTVSIMATRNGFLKVYRVVSCCEEYVGGMKPYK